MLPIVSTSPSENIKDFIKADKLYVYAVDEQAVCIRSLSITNTIRHQPKDKTLQLLLVNGFVYSSTIDYIGHTVSVFTRSGEHIEPRLTREQAQTILLQETLPASINQVICYKEGPVFAMCVPSLFPGGFGATNGVLIVEKLLSQGFVQGKKVESPIGHYWVFTRSVAYIPAVAAQALPVSSLPVTGGMDEQRGAAAAATAEVPAGETVLRQQ